MTVVVGTAGHIDHGKTTLLRALTGIDADRLPEERRRGMTIDVGYAHFILPSAGATLDFVDVPGHDRLVGNMLVGAGEIDAALLVVAADDGPRAQTLEHLELLDALGIQEGLVVVTKADVVDQARVHEVGAEVGALLAATSLRGSPILPVSAVTGYGLDDVLAALVDLEQRVTAQLARSTGGPPRLAIDRVFSVRGRGIVVTGSLRGRGLTAGETVQIEPDGGRARIREVQVHGKAVDGTAQPGRTALNLVGTDASRLRRGQVLTVGPGIEVTDRLLVVLRPPTALAGADGPGTSGGADNRRWPPADGMRLRLHLGTEQVGARIGHAGRDAVDLLDGRRTAMLRLEEPVAAAIGDAFVLRRPSPGMVVAGGRVLDPVPPRGASRRRVDAGRLGRVAVAIEEARAGGTLARAGGAGPRAAGDTDHQADRAKHQASAEEVIAALVDLHGALPAGRLEAVAALTHTAPAAGVPPAGELVLARDITEELERLALARVTEHHVAAPLSQGIPIADLRPALAIELRRMAAMPERAGSATAGRLLDRLVDAGRLARHGDRLRDPSRQPGVPPALAAAMGRLEALLSTAAPPSLKEAARTAGCPTDGVRALESSGRIVRLEDDLAYAAPAYHRLAAQALGMARRGPLSPAAYRDATGTSRKYVLAILEDLDRRGILRRGPEGHLVGPRAPADALARTLDGHPDP